MSPVTAVKTVLKKYVVFSGRARRSEYWWFWLFGVVLGVVALIIDVNVFGTDGATTAGGGNVAVQATAGPATLVLGLVLLLPSIAVAVRRLHDIGRTGWWYLIGLVPLVGPIVLLVFFVQDSKPDNEYGPNPKGVQPYVAA